MTDEQLLRALTTVSPEKLPLLTEHYKAITDRQRLENERWRGNGEAVNKFAEIAIKALLLLCGGGAIALLAFAGNAVKDTALSSEQALGYSHSVCIFGFAAAASVVTAGLSYLAQVVFVEVENESINFWLGQTLRAAAVVLWFVGVALFIYGLVNASGAIQARSNISGPRSDLEIQITHPVPIYPGRALLER